MPDHVDRQRRQLERNQYYLKPEPLLQDRSHAAGKHAYKISTRDYGRDFQEFVHLYGLPRLQPRELLQSRRQLFDGAPAMEGHEFLLKQLLDRSTRFYSGMTASDQNCNMVIEKLPVHEWAKCRRQPVNSDNYDAIA